MTFFIISCASNKKNTNNELVQQAIRKNFLNNFQHTIADLSLDSCKLITFSRYNYHFLDKYQEQIAHLYPSFSSDDYKFIITQINNYEDEENKNIEANIRLRKLTLINESEIKALGTTYTTFWESFHKHFGSVPFIECSKPLFSKNLDYVVMEIDVKAKPTTNFVKGVYVFKRVNSKWTYFKKLQ